MNDYNRGVMPWAGKDSVGENSLVGQNIGYSLHSQEKSTSDLLNLMIKDIWYSQVFSFVVFSISTQLWKMKSNSMNFQR